MSHLLARLPTPVESSSKYTASVGEATGLKIIDIWINCPDEAVAEKISECLVSERLVAVSNIYPAVRSTYWWHGRVERETQVPLRLKTRAALFEKVIDQVKAMHPFETPSIVGVEIAYVNDDYRDWVIAETESSSATGRNVSGKE